MPVVYQVLSARNPPVARSPRSIKQGRSGAGIFLQLKLIAEEEGMSCISSIIALEISGTVAGWYSGSVAQWHRWYRWYSGTAVQWYSGTVGTRVSGVV